MYLCWSAKGGSGTTVFAAALALVMGQRRPTLIVDLDGDAPATLGLAQPSGPGVAEWLASPSADALALANLTVPVTDGVELLHRGGQLPARPRWADLAHCLAQLERTVVIDAGTGIPPLELHHAAQQRLLVLRPCYLAVRRAVANGVQPTGLVVVHEPGRVLTARELSRVLNAPLVAEVDYDPNVARCVDAGLLSTRLPRPLAGQVSQSWRGAA